MEQIQILQAMKERLFENGWMQGSFGSESGPNCILGALTLVSGGAWVHQNSLEDLLEEEAGMTIDSYNDREDTTFDDIMDLIDKVIEKLEGGVVGKYRCPAEGCGFEVEEWEKDGHYTCNDEEWIPVEPVNDPPVDLSLRRARLAEVRSKQPEVCWRPRGDWGVCCILLLGHEGRCGWEV